jgi:hypothetical protein
MVCYKCNHAWNVHKENLTPGLKQPCLLKGCKCIDYEPDIDEIMRSNDHSWHQKEVGF